jgi:ADP-ribose pyrophosphatase
MEDGMQAETTLSSRAIFDGEILRVRIDTVRLPDGRRASREVVEHKPAVVVVPIDADDNVVLVRQYRYAVGATLLEAPAGGVEEGEAPADCAQRELQEETGFLARSLRSLGQFWTTPGFCDELMYVYLASDLAPSALDPDPDEFIETVKTPISGIAGLIRGGEIQDAKTIAALLMATCVFDRT